MKILSFKEKEKRQFILKEILRRQKYSRNSNDKIFKKEEEKKKIAQT